MPPCPNSASICGGHGCEVTWAMASSDKIAPVTSRQMAYRIITGGQDRVPTPETLVPAAANAISTRLGRMINKYDQGRRRLFTPAPIQTTGCKQREAFASLRTRCAKAGAALRLPSSQEKHRCAMVGTTPWRPGIRLVLRRHEAQIDPLPLYASHRNGRATADTYQRSVPPPWRKRRKYSNNNSACLFSP